MTAAMMTVASQIFAGGVDSGIGLECGVIPGDESSYAAISIDVPNWREIASLRSQ
jgi:hypothetical protein